MTTSEEKRLQNRRHQQTYRSRPEHKEQWRVYMRRYRARKGCWLATALLKFARLQFERMERQGV